MCLHEYFSNHQSPLALTLIVLLSTTTNSDLHFTPKFSVEFKTGLIERNGGTVIFFCWSQEATDLYGGFKSLSGKDQTKTSVSWLQTIIYNFNFDVVIRLNSSFNYNRFPWLVDQWWWCFSLVDHSINISQ